HFFFRREERARAEAAAFASVEDGGRPLWQNAAYFAAMVAILIFANWGRPSDPVGFWNAVYGVKWPLTALAGAVLAVMVVRWLSVPAWKVLSTAAATAVAALLFPGQPLAPFSVALVGLSLATASSEGEAKEWFSASWGFAKQILPLLLFGVLVAGALLGRPGHEGLVPSEWVSRSVGGNSIGANFFASAAGALMYFATLTEVPILQGLIGSGMGKGPALALLLAGPALSLPNMLVIRSIMGTKKTVVFVSLVVIMATVSGLLFGAAVGQG
ncbi:MAG: permease, partial [Armatimonadota bacterium]|nr:permease [Armatimonadota bacterium]